MIKLIRWVVPVCAGAFAMLLLSGCATNLFPGGPSIAGVLYTGVTDPAQNLAVAVEPGPGAKVGEASSMGIFGLFAFGDAGLDTAMKNGGITKVHHVDHQVQLVLWGLWARTKTVVHGD
jgi:hypothetical protein